MARSSLLTRVLTSIFFRRANTKALRYARNSTILFTLIRQALTKSNGLTGKDSVGFREQIGLLTRMVRAYAAGEYRETPWKSLIRLIAVLIYFVSPIDIIPDFLPLVGFADDIALVVWLFTGIKADIDKFSEWERSRNTVRIG